MNCGFGRRWIAPLAIALTNCSSRAEAAKNRRAIDLAHIGPRSREAMPFGRPLVMLDFW